MKKKKKEEISSDVFSSVVPGTLRIIIRLNGATSLSPSSFYIIYTYRICSFIFEYQQSDTHRSACVCVSFTQPSPCYYYPFNVGGGSRLNRTGIILICIRRHVRDGTKGTIIISIYYNNNDKLVLLLSRIE